MGSELLKKEKEYHELNKKLEMKTKELLHEVGNVMKLQENIHNNIPKFDASKYQIDDHRSVLRKSKSANIMKKNNVLKLDPKDCKDLNIPEDVNNMGSKCLMNFLKAKTKQLQADYEKLVVDYKQKCEESKKYHRDNNKLLEEREKWLHATAGSKNHATKMEQQIDVLQSKVHTKENENISLKKEVEQLQKELKATKLSAANLEVRLTRAAEENQKIKNALKIAKRTEKELEECHKKEIAELSQSIKNVEKHKTELTNGFKKQLLLIDNLKKQKVHIEAFKITDKYEMDFKKLLEYKD